MIVQKFKHEIPNILNFLSSNYTDCEDEQVASITIDKKIEEIYQVVFFISIESKALSKIGLM
ncbi:MAG: hypothetical protein ACR5KW_01845 [Wolbachia sp.]